MMILSLRNDDSPLRNLLFARVGTLPAQSSLRFEMTKFRVLDIAPYVED